MPKTVQAPSRKGMKLKTLPVSEKLKILDRIESGASMHMVCEEFDIKKSTFYDIRKAKDKLRSFSLAREDPENKSGSGSSTRRIRAIKYSELDAAVYKWYQQERSVGVSVRGIDIQSAAQRLATAMG